jgi:hypothetical protein
MIFALNWLPRYQHNGGVVVIADNFPYNTTMKANEFRSLKVDSQLRYLADIRGVPKDTIAIVEQKDVRDDGNGNRTEELCRVRVVTIPEGSKQMPFLKHLLTIFESEADSFEKVAGS